MVKLFGSVVYSSNFTTSNKPNMAKEKEESVKLKSSVVNLVRSNKEITGVPIGTFFEQAATEKLKSQPKKKRL